VAIACVPATCSAAHHTCPRLHVRCTQRAITASIKAACVNRDLLGALMALAAGLISRAAKMSDEDHQVRV
jgi:hypothetical protein